jgi:hypothetical protein
MRMRGAIPLGVAAVLLLPACRATPPAITFTEVPPAAEGGPDRTARIAGGVQGARRGDRIVLFAKSGLWYVQPYLADPFTAIGEDSTWSASTHLGQEYAALLVRGGFVPPATLEALPAVGEQVAAVARVPGTADASGPPPRTVEFSGYRWAVRQIPSDRGGTNDYDPDNVRVDAEGALHLSVAERRGRWTSAEVRLSQALGYGTYAFVVRDIGQLDPATVMAIYTYDDSVPVEHFREMAVTFQRPDRRTRTAGRYVLQPGSVAGNVAGFVVPPGVVTHSLRWEPGRVVFTSNPGGKPALAPSRVGHEFTVGVPSSGDERVRLALYYRRDSPLPPQGHVEVVIERFQFFP